MAAAAALLALSGTWAATRTTGPAPSERRSAPRPPDVREQGETLAGLRPPKRAVPVVAVLGLNDGSETTDYLVPYGVLSASRLAKVIALAPEPRPITLMPALRIQPQATPAVFDARYPDGADYVIVPAMHRADDPTVLAWIRSQASKGATIVGICEGALVLSHAGLLRDRAATTHWYSVGKLRQENPGMRWARDRRYVADRGVVTTTGVSASLPVSLALVEAIGGRVRAEALAQELGVDSWDARHDSAVFALDRGHLLTGAGNLLAFWRHETVGLPVEDGVDEIALALAANAWATTYRSRVIVLSASGAPLATRRGLTLLPEASTDVQPDLVLMPVTADRPARALDDALVGIAARYGAPTAAFVALLLEAPMREPRFPARF